MGTTFQVSCCTIRCWKRFNLGQPSGVWPIQSSAKKTPGRRVSRQDCNLLRWDSLRKFRLSGKCWNSARRSNHKNAVHFLENSESRLSFLNYYSGRRHRPTRTRKATRLQENQTRFCSISKPDCRIFANRFLPSAGCYLNPTPTRETQQATNDPHSKNHHQND